MSLMKIVRDYKEFNKRLDIAYNAWINENGSHVVAEDYIEDEWKKAGLERGNYCKTAKALVAIMHPIKIFGLASIKHTLEKK